jgi:hypothetical protein
MLNSQSYYDKWNHKADGLLTEALHFLSAFAENPFDEEQLRRWIAQLSQFRIQPDHLNVILEIIGKDDSHLQEAGIVMATSGSRHVPSMEVDFENVLVRVLSKNLVDLWIIRAIIRFLGAFIGNQGPQFTRVYKQLADWLKVSKETKNDKTRLTRTMYINPKEELLDLFEQHLLQTLAPTERIKIILPILENHYETDGWMPTLNKILEKKQSDIS